MKAQRGFTLKELITVLVITVALAALLMVLLDRWRYEARVQKDREQVRGIHQGLVMWVPSNNDEYPLPSRLDRHNITVADEGRAKDTTANIMSLTVACGVITPEMLVSPLEVNRNIRVFRDYEYDSPRRAADQARADHALWDPGLSADFTAPGGGHVSYAHLPPVGPRRAKWANTFVATEAVLGTRGPLTVGVRDLPGGAVAPVLADEESLTLRLFRPRGAWSGHVVFNDNHVEYLTAPQASEYKDAAGRRRPDLLFYDEADDRAADNNYLSIFIRAGATPEEYRAIWD